MTVIEEENKLQKDNNKSQLKRQKSGTNKRACGSNARLCNISTQLGGEEKARRVFFLQNTAKTKTNYTETQTMSALKKERVKQVPKFMQATVTCTQQSILYGQCIMKHYQNMSKDACAAEFGAYKKCVQSVLGRKW